MSGRDGGPAFPQHDTFTDRVGEIVTHSLSSGITIRDYFASRALQVLVSRLWEDDMPNHDDKNRELMADIAAQCYKYADAMLSEREKNDR